MLWQQQQKQNKGNKKIEHNQAKSSFFDNQSTELTNHRQQISELSNQNNQQQNDKDYQFNKKKNKNLKSKFTNDTDDYSPQLQSSTNTFATVNFNNISPAELTTTTGSVILLRNLTRADIDSVLSCSANHPLYPSAINSSIKLNVNCKFFVINFFLKVFALLFLVSLGNIKLVLKTPFK